MKILLAFSAVSAIAAGCTSAPGGDDPDFASTGGKTDSSWSHIELQSAEGASIKIDYELTSKHTPAEMFQVADPVWINVSRADLATASGVHVWVGSQIYNANVGYDSAVNTPELMNGPAHDLDLSASHDPTRFSGQIDGGLEASEHTDGDESTWNDAYQFAIEIDGQWQTDPVSGTHNFLAKDLF